MNNKRKLELLAYAKVCFEKCTNPFEHTHLLKKKVRADECVDLSHIIAVLIEEAMYLDAERSENVQYLLKLAEKEFMETQEES